MDIQLNQNSNSSYSIIHALLYLAAVVVILWYLRYWYRTMISIQSHITNPTTTNIEKTNAIQYLATTNLHTNPSNTNTDANANVEGFMDIADKSYRMTDTNKGPFPDLIDESEYSKTINLYDHNDTTHLEKIIPHFASLNKNYTSIDDQDSGYANGLDTSHLTLPPMTTYNTCPQRPYPVDRRDRNREQQLRMISQEIRDRKLLSEDAYRTKYAWHNITSRALNLPPGFGRATPRLTEDGSSYEYAYTGDIRDAQTRTPMDILADYPRHEWKCNRLYQRCSAPEHLLGNAPEYYRRIKANEDKRNAAEQIAKSIQAQLPPQTLPPVYPS